MYICSTNDYNCHTNVIRNNKVMKKEGKRMYSYRVPESLYDEIDRMVKLRINEYERELLTGEKKSNPADESLFTRDYNSAYNEPTIEPKVVEIENAAAELKDKGRLTSKAIDRKDLQITENPSAHVKKVKIKALQEMADLIKNGGGTKNVAFTTVKKPIDEIYDCVIVEKGVPVESDRVYYGSNNRIAFWDRDDATVFYVNWEGKYYRFANSSQFNKFCKDNNLK